MTPRAPTSQRQEAPRGGFPPFDLGVKDGGYAWWYLDAWSDDGQHGLTVIAFVGSVFSPYYAWARRSGRGEAVHHCALNVALYGNRGKRWTLTERGREAVQRHHDHLVLGPSCIGWEGDGLNVDIDEITVPLPSRIRGRVRLEPSVPVDRRFNLDAAGRHEWWPVAPCARVEVGFEQPALRWRGSGYFDHNTGSEPLEAAFDGWDWARARNRDGTLVLYDVRRRDAVDNCLALRCGPAGQVESFQPPPQTELKPSAWRLIRRARDDRRQGAQVVATLEDTPFYVRSRIASDIQGERVLAFHESLCMKRFANPLVQLMLPFRMPRRSGWPASAGAA